MLHVQRRNVLILPLLLAAVLSYCGAFLLRFDFTLPESAAGVFRAGLWIFLFSKGFSFLLFRLQRSRWRQAGLFDLSRFVIANLTASLIASAATLVIVGFTFPRSIYAIDAALCVLATAALPLSVRLYWEVLVPNAAQRNGSRAILVYGAGVAGSLLTKEVRSNVKMKTSVVGFLDDDDSKTGAILDGVPVRGAGRDARRVVAQLAQEGTPVSEIVIAMPSVTASQMRTVITHCRAAGVPFKTLPGLSELLHGSITRQIREVSAQDLLGREPITIDESRIRQAICGESVLVTGGCGSIGSELCRQLARFNPRALVIFDQAESEMFMLALDLRKRFPNLNLVTEIGDIARPARVRETISRREVGVVFHAAAYKHVPLMEEHLIEAIENNVIGTYNVARAAHLAGVKKFVLISSDKAVNPTSIMGLTKRLAELIVSTTPLDGGPKRGAFVSVRFGNVLGSAGSVIPIFQRQIAAGGPVTVTHPEMRRYFMSISEAVQLVLQASSMGEGSEVFVLDMGEQIPIMELARNMIRLGGLVPGEDIDIRITGLRPGEKLFEELQLDGENTLPTPHAKIRRFRSALPNPRHVARWLERLRIILMERNEQALRAHLVQLVPEYQGAAAAFIGDRQADRLNRVAQAS